MECVGLAVGLVEVGANLISREVSKLNPYTEQVSKLKIMPM